MVVDGGIGSDGRGIALIPY